MNQKWLRKIKEWLFYLFLFLLPWQTRLIIKEGKLNAAYWEYGTISVYAVEFLLWLIIILTGIEIFLSFYTRSQNYKFKINFQSLKKFQIPKANIFYFLGILFFFAFISSLIAFRPFLSFYWLLRLSEGLAIFLIIFFQNFNLERIVIAFVGGAVLQAVLGLCQFFTQYVFPSKWLGMAEQIPAILGTSVVEVNGLRFLRAYGSLPHPNILGAYLLIAIILLFYGFKSLLIRNRLSLSLSIVSYFCLIAGMFFSFSRAGWLAFLIVVFISLWPLVRLIILFFRRKIEKNYPLSFRAFFSQDNNIPIYYFLFWSGFLFFLILFFSFWPLARARLFTQGYLEIKSNEERIVGYQQSWQLIKKHFWLGVGPANYTLAVHHELDELKPAWAYQPVHNVYLLVFSEIGIFGILAFISLFIFLLKNCYLSRVNCKEIPSMIVLSLIILLFFDHFWWSLALGMWLFWFTFGIAVRFLSCKTQS
jgi:O-antigen ligase